MAKTQNYSAETREKAVRLVGEHAGDYASEYAPGDRPGNLLGQEEQAAVAAVGS